MQNSILSPTTQHKQRCVLNFYGCLYVCHAIGAQYEE